MLRNIFLIVIFLFSLHSCVPCQQDKLSNRFRDGRLSKMEIPNSQRDTVNLIVFYKGFSVSYNPVRKTPDWVAWELTNDEAAATDVPRDKGFYQDVNLDAPQASTADYKGSNWSRGHMAPAADMKWDSTAMHESCYYTNICPQDKRLNNGAWNVLENRCRSWAKAYGQLYIASGPIYDANDSVIGLGVHVPDAFFKVVLARVEGNWTGCGYVMDNAAPASNKIEDYECTIDEVEERTGIDFFFNLPDEIEKDVECAIWSR